MKLRGTVAMLAIFLLLADPILGQANDRNLVIPEGVSPTSDLGRLVMGWNLVGTITVGEEISLEVKEVYVSLRDPKSDSVKTGWLRPPGARFDRTGKLLEAQASGRWQVLAQFGATYSGAFGEVRWGTNGTLLATLKTWYGEAHVTVPNVVIEPTMGTATLRIPDGPVQIDRNPVGLIQDSDKFKNPSVCTGRLSSGKLIVDLVPVLPSWLKTSEPIEVAVLPSGMVESDVKVNVHGTYDRKPGYPLEVTSLAFAAKEYFAFLNYAEIEGFVTLPGPWGKGTLAPTGVYFYDESPSLGSGSKSWAIDFPAVGLRLAGAARSSRLKFEKDRDVFDGDLKVFLAQAPKLVFEFPEAFEFSPADGKIFLADDYYTYSRSSWGHANLTVKAVTPQNKGLLIHGATTIPEKTDFQFRRSYFQMEDFWVPPSGDLVPVQLKVEEGDTWPLFDTWELEARRVQLTGDRLTVDGAFWFPLPLKPGAQQIPVRNIEYDLATGRTRSPEQKGLDLHFTLKGVDFRMTTMAVRPDVLRLVGTATMPKLTHDGKAMKSRLAGLSLRIARLDITSDGRVAALQAFTKDSKQVLGKSEVLTEEW